MKVDIDYRFGQSLYIVNDEEQLEYRLHRVIICPKGIVVLELFKGDGDIIEIPEVFISKERDVVKATGGNKKDDEED